MLFLDYRLSVMPPLRDVEVLPCTVQDPRSPEACMRRARNGTVVWLLLAAAMVTTGCASRAPAGGWRKDLSYARHSADGTESTSGLSDEPSRSSAPMVSDEDPELARQAVLAAVASLKDSTDNAASALSRLAARPPGMGDRGVSGISGIFTRYLDYGSHQVPWIQGSLRGATTLANAASQAGDPDMESAILQMTGPRLEAALFGAMVVTAWLDFLQLADTVLRKCPAYGVETLFMDMQRVQRLIEPTLAALASGEPEQIEAAALAMPALMGQLTREFGTLRDGARTAMEGAGKAIAAAQFVEMLTMVSALKMSLPRPPPAVPATLGAGLVMGSGGVMAGSRVVVSAGWVELIRRLVQAGILSVPVVSSAVRIHSGQVLMAQGDLPKGVREALGDGPEVRAMRETGKAGAGMSEAPKHHVLPDEYRAWFEKRGFTGDMDIDEFCVQLERAHHEAIHGGGDWRLGRLWPNEWNRMIMKALLDAEAKTGRMLTRGEILKLVAKNMRNYKIPMNFTSGRRR